MIEVKTVVKEVVVRVNIGGTEHELLPSEAENLNEQLNDALEEIDRHG